jgi:hypothetical protein
LKRFVFAGGDVGVERRTKKKTKKKKAPVKLEEKKPEPAPPTLLNALLNAEEGGEEEEEEKKVVKKAKETEKIEEKPNALGLLLSSGVGMEGEEEEEEEAEEEREEENPIEEGDSLEEEEEEEKKKEKDEKSSNGSNWTLKSTLKNVWGSAGAKLSNLIAIESPAHFDEIEKAQTERESDLQSCNYILRVALLNVSTSAFTAIQTNVNILLDGLTGHLAVLVKARSDASTANEALGKMAANLEELKQFHF